MYWANEDKTAIIVNDKGARVVYKGTKEFESIDKSKVTFQELPPEQIKLQRIAELKNLLRDTDYVALSDYDQEKPELISQRAEWRAEIRALEK